MACPTKEATVEVTAACTMPPSGGHSLPNLAINSVIASGSPTSTATVSTVTPVRSSSTIADNAPISTMGSPIRIAAALAFDPRARGAMRHVTLANSPSQDRSRRAHRLRDMKGSWLKRYGANVRASCRHQSGNSTYTVSPCHLVLAIIGARRRRRLLSPLWRPSSDGSRSISPPHSSWMLESKCSPETPDRGLIGGNHIFHPASRPGHHASPSHVRTPGRPRRPAELRNASSVELQSGVFDSHALLGRRDRRPLWAVGAAPPLLALATLRRDRPPRAKSAAGTIMTLSFTLGSSVCEVARRVVLNRPI